MKIKKTLSILLFTISFLSLSQEKDSIFNLLDKKGKITNDKEKAYNFEIITKKNDTTWFVRNYNRKGKLKSQTNYTSQDKKVKTGEEIFYHNNGVKRRISFYNNKGEKQGRFIRWFRNQKISGDGTYVKNSKEGLWKFYHFNGRLALRAIFKEDKLLRADFYDEKGKKENFKISKNNKCNCSPAKFKGGKKQFKRKLVKLQNAIDYKINGEIYVNFLIGIDGRINEVSIDEKLPEDLRLSIIDFFKKIKGWRPAKHFNRKIPSMMTVPLKFKM